MVSQLIDCVWPHSVSQVTAPPCLASSTVEDGVRAFTIEAKTPRGIETISGVKQSDVMAVVESGLCALLRELAREGNADGVRVLLDAGVSAFVCTRLEPMPQAFEPIVTDALIWCVLPRVGRQATQESTLRCTWRLVIATSKCAVC